MTMRLELQKDIIVCDRETARSIWNEQRELRPFVWLEQEVTDALLLGPAEIEKIKELKRGKSGYVFKEGNSLDTPSELT
jgi:hypothetical protein